MSGLHVFVTKLVAPVIASHYYCAVLRLFLVPEKGGERAVSTLCLGEGEESEGEQRVVWVVQQERERMGLSIVMDFKQMVLAYLRRCQRHEP